MKRWNEAWVSHAIPRSQNNPTNECGWCDPRCDDSPESKKRCNNTVKWSWGSPERLALGVVKFQGNGTITPSKWPVTKMLPRKQCDNSCGSWMAATGHAEATRIRSPPKNAAHREMTDSTNDRVSHAEDRMDLCMEQWIISMAWDWCIPARQTQRKRWGNAWKWEDGTEEADYRVRTYNWKLLKGAESDLQAKGRQ